MTSADMKEMEEKAKEKYLKLFGPSKGRDDMVYVKGSMSGMEYQIVPGETFGVGFGCRMRGDDRAICVRISTIRSGVVYGGYQWALSVALMISSDEQYFLRTLTYQGFGPYVDEARQKAGL